jgi:SAM-dependent methyltransferase
MDFAEQPRQSLATGFRDVDTSGDTGACHRCLDLIAGIPFFQEVKHDSIRIIRDTNAMQVLDAGCGAGTDLITLHAALPESRVIGIDASSSLIARAAERTAGIGNRCSLVKGDLLNIPFRAGSFDACRIDRVLQHIHEPKRAIRELIRILKPEGMLVAFDNDWETFSINLDDEELADRIRRFWRNSFASGRIGRDLPRILQDCGVENIHAEPRVLTLSDRSLASQVFDLPHLLERMRKAGVMTTPKTNAVVNELQRRGDEGTFSSGYTGFLVRGTVPEQV